jgi:hypothetical protein
MELIKLCPACFEENPVSEVICRVCMTNLSSVSPSPKNEKGPNGLKDAGGTDSTPDTHEHARPGEDPRPPTLTLSILSRVTALRISGACELGRNGPFGAFFSGIQTVSRRHVKIDFADNGWRIEDLGSTNGTWVNGKRISPGQAVAIKTGDTVSLSLSCEMTVTE